LYISLKSKGLYILHNKQYQLINFLLSQKGRYISSKVLADVLNVTGRTIRNYIKNINNNFNNIVINSSSQGYAIVGNDILTIGGIYEDEESFLEFQIIKFLLNKKRYVSYDEIADKFFYSSQTIRSRIQNLARKIQFLDIDVSVDTKVFKGIKLIGREIQKRVLLENFFTSITVKKEMYMDFVIENFSSWISKDIIRYIFKILDNINNSYQLNLDFSMYKKLIAQLVITIHQSKYQLFVEIESKEIERLKQFKEFDIGKKLQADLQKYMKIPNKEMAFLVNYLISMQLNIEESTLENKDKEIVKIIESILRQIESDYNVPVHSKESFKKNIVNHIYRILYPVFHNLRIYNPFVKETKAQYFFSFSIASSIALQMKKELSLEVQDSEIAYLTYHIQVVLDTQRK